MWFLRIAEELSVGLNSPVEDSPFALSPPHSRLCYFVYIKNQRPQIKNLTTEKALI